MVAGSAVAVTARLAVLEGAPAVGVCVLVAPLVENGLVPTLVLLTCSVTVHPPLGRLGMVRFSAVAPTINAGLLVTAAQVPPMVELATLIFVSVAVKLALVNVALLLLPTVRVRVLVLPVTMLAGLNAALTEGGLGEGSSSNRTPANWLSEHYCPQTSSGDFLPASMPTPRHASKTSASRRRSRADTCKSLCSRGTSARRPADRTRKWRMQVKCAGVTFGYFSLR